MSETQVTSEKGRSMSGPTAELARQAMAKQIRRKAKVLGLRVKSVRGRWFIADKRDVLLSDRKGETAECALEFLRVAAE